MNKREKVLEIKDLCVDFRTVEGTVRAVNHLSYTLHKGEKLGIVGESGSGTSVSSLGIMQLIPNPPGQITRGAIIYKGEDLVHASERLMQQIRGNEISMIFQEPMTSLNAIIKCGKQIAESLRLHRGMKKKEAMEEAIRMMRAVGIANPEVRAHEYPHQMSGGMRQRVMIAMALACQPQILIADEPTTALDVTIQAQILDLIRDLNESMGTSVLFITHDLGVVSELCDTVIVMYTGHIVEKAPVRELFKDPKHPYTIGFRRSMVWFLIRQSAFMVVHSGQDVRMRRRNANRINHQLLRFPMNVRFVAGYMQIRKKVRRFSRCLSMKKKYWSKPIM